MIMLYNSYVIIIHDKNKAAKLKHNEKDYWLNSLVSNHIVVMVGAAAVTAKNRT